ncbi:uncharacterized protein [Oscarella lobularis]|uniref:uncharacterized protein isoform X2 n=1 Tax=Oscarella lobularis TaxID=121494 RepID=UPI003313575B
MQGAGADEREFICLSDRLCLQIAEIIGPGFWKFLAETNHSRREEIIKADYPLDAVRQAFEAIKFWRSSFEGSEEEKSKKLYRILRKIEYFEAADFLIYTSRPRSYALDTTKTRQFARGRRARLSQDVPKTPDLRWHSTRKALSEKQRDRRSKDDLELVVGMTQSLNYRLIKPAFSPPYNEVGYADEDNESHAVTEASRLIEKPKYFHQVTRLEGSKLLMKESEGTFLVRKRGKNSPVECDEEGNPHTYTIMVVTEKEICNLKVFVKITGQAHMDVDASSSSSKKFPDSGQNKAMSTARREAHC